MSEPLKLLDKVTIRSARFPHQTYNGQIGTVTRRVIHSPGSNWEYDVHPFSHEHGVISTADELHQADSKEDDYKG